jgi:hypothetical protein
MLGPLLGAGDRRLRTHRRSLRPDSGKPLLAKHRAHGLHRLFVASAQDWVQGHAGCCPQCLGRPTQPCGTPRLPRDGRQPGQALARLRQQTLSTDRLADLDTLPKRAMSSTARKPIRAAANSMANGMPSSRAQIWATAPALAALSVKLDRRACARTTEQPHRLIVPHEIRLGQATRVGNPQRGHTPGHFAGHTERLPAGGQDVEARTALQQCTRQPGAARRH